MMQKTNEEIAKCFGLEKRSDETKYNIDNQKAPHIQVFGVEKKSGFMLHYGLLFRTKKQNYVIHINSQTKIVFFEKAETAFAREKLNSDFKAIYTFMLPWHAEK